MKRDIPNLNEKDCNEFLIELIYSNYEIKHATTESIHYYLMGRSDYRELYWEVLRKLKRIASITNPTLRKRFERKMYKPYDRLSLLADKYLGRVDP